MKTEDNKRVTGGEIVHISTVLDLVIEDLVKKSEQKTHNEGEKKENE